METKHTPGPWIAETAENGGFDIEAENPKYVIICSRRAWPHRANESIANARLIAAAPELLEALIGVVKVADRSTVEFDAARAAIAKATA